jgi:hypothetical protein
MKATANYTDAWKDYRRRLRWLYRMWIGAVPVLATGIYLTTHLKSPWPFCLIVFPYAVACGIVQMWVDFFYVRDAANIISRPAELQMCTDIICSEGLVVFAIYQSGAMEALTPIKPVIVK